jgi:hypothetical protein
LKEAKKMANHTITILPAIAPSISVIDARLKLAACMSEIPEAGYWTPAESEAYDNVVETAWEVLRPFLPRREQWEYRNERASVTKREHWEFRYGKAYVFCHIDKSAATYADAVGEEPYFHERDVLEREEADTEALRRDVMAALDDQLKLDNSAYEFVQDVVRRHVWCEWIMHDFEAEKRARRNEVSRLAALSSVPEKAARLALGMGEEYAVECLKELRALRGTADEAQRHVLKNCGVARRKAVLRELMGGWLFESFAVYKMGKAHLNDLCAYLLG